jgi:hypothetical protein
MASRTLISVEEYLRTSYRPDCDYVDGKVIERNLGEKSHAKLQKALLLFLSARERELGIWAIQEQHVQVSAKRFRIPDICVTLGEPPEQIFTKPPPSFASKSSPLKTAGRASKNVSTIFSPWAYLTSGYWTPRLRRPTRPRHRNEHSKLPPESSRLRTLLSNSLLAKSFRN